MGETKCAMIKRRQKQGCIHPWASSDTLPLPWTPAQPRDLSPSHHSHGCQLITTQSMLSYPLISQYWLSSFIFLSFDHLLYPLEQCGAQKPKLGIPSKWSWDILTIRKLNDIQAENNKLHFPQRWTTSLDRVVILCYIQNLDVTWCDHSVKRCCSKSFLVELTVGSPHTTRAQHCWDSNRWREYSCQPPVKRHTNEMFLGTTYLIAHPQSYYVGVMVYMGEVVEDQPGAEGRVRWTVAEGRKRRLLARSLIEPSKT